jgi:hypothetical protein
LGWSPSSEEDDVYFSLHKRGGGRADGEFKLDAERVRAVLIKDLASKDSRVMENAAALVIVRSDEALLGPLIDVLEVSGTVHLAEIYLNSGHAQLKAAATQWAKAHGYSMRTFVGGSTSPIWHSGSD